MGHLLNDHFGSIPLLTPKGITTGAPAERIGSARSASNGVALSLDEGREQ
jgi:hypothetical protein